MLGLKLNHVSKSVELFDNPVSKHIKRTLHSIVYDYIIFIETDRER